MLHSLQESVLMCCLGRNTVAPTIQQQLLYVGDESGKLLAIRDIIRKVLVMAYHLPFV